MTPKTVPYVSPPGAAEKSARALASKTFDELPIGMKFTLSENGPIYEKDSSTVAREIYSHHLLWPNKSMVDLKARLFWVGG